MSNRALTFLFGTFTWTAPAWLRRAVSDLRSHRKASIFLFLFLFLSIFGGWQAWRWYQSRPKLERIAVTVAPIPVTPLEKDIHPANLVMRFSQSAAPLDRIGKPAGAGIHLDPPAAGNWAWTSDQQLVFAPKYDWPAGQEYTVILDRKYFPRHVLLDRYDPKVTTPSFAATIRQTEFYQDPKDPGLRQVVATVEFTHSVNRREFEKRITLAFVGGANIFRTSGNASRFTVVYGLHDRIAYIRSVPLSLPEHEDFMRVVLHEGITTTQGGAHTTRSDESKVRVPDIYSFFQIDDSKGTIVRNDDGQPEQVLIVTTTAAAKPEEIKKSLHLFLLPKRTSPEESHWESPREVDDETLQHATLVKFTALPPDHEQTTVHAFRIAVEEQGELYLRIDKDTQAVGGFLLRNNYDAIIPVPVPPREIAIAGAGGILALNGERKISIKSRGVPVIEYELARVATTQINHLITQSQGRFDNPHFFCNFSEENISRLAVEHQTIALTNSFSANYSSFDFSSHLQLPADGGSERGLFFIRAQQWDPVQQRVLPNVFDRRFILVTDIGMLVKKSVDGSSDVFLVSIKSGNPLAQVTVEVLGKNGVAVARGTSGSDGRVSFPAFEKETRERTPVAFVARLGNDVAFMPFERADRLLDFSRFDIGGVENMRPGQLDAFLFTERGVYRPGDEVHIGYVVKQRDWHGQLAGLPLEIEVLDGRGQRAQLRKITLPASGFAELTFPTAYESPTGEYQVSLYLIRNGWRDQLLGSTDFQVKEFLPDRMHLTSELSAQRARGWIDPKNVRAHVTLRNLYGTPASDRRITSQMELSPAAFHFAEYNDYVFGDPLRDAKRELRSQTIDLGETKTDAAGQATVNLGLEHFADATYQLSLCQQGFEAEGGRSVAAYNTALVSALAHVIGYKADRELSYLPKDRPHEIEFVAINPELNKVAVDKLQFRLIEQTYVSILAKKESGTYAYESVLQERLVKSDSLTIGGDGLHYPIDTGAPGNFVLQVRDEAGVRVSQVCFSVVGKGNVSRSLEKNSELQVKLDRQQYNAGDEIEISLTAPYTGAGLITIESDKVQAHQWFSSSTTSSVQHIRVPDGFDGTGYVNVSFVRGLDSKEIFMSPLSYAVAPFTVNKERRRLHVEMHAAELTRPGEPLRITYKADRPAHIVIFAVDKGILQVTDFETPDPLGYFFRKTALAVDTSQIVDLIMPEFSILRASSSAGGDGDAEKRLNPFKRVTEKPVVFWSGVLDADSTEREVSYDVPDYFDGTLTIMAVAVAPDAAGSAEQDTVVRGPFVITPSVPTVAAPGDVFEVGVTVANNVAGSGEKAEIALTSEPSAQLEILKTPPQPLRIPEGREATVIFTVRVRDQLGAASLVFHGFAATGEESTRRATLSIRPPIPFITTVRGGNFGGSSVNVPIERSMHAEFRHLDATVSAVSLGLARGLDFYLKSFPHGCTEQITSASFSRLLLANEADFGLSRAEVTAQLEKTFATLRRRQNDQGAFGYWSAATGEGSDFVSVYATHFLIEAKTAGFPPPNDILHNALHNLQAMAAREPHDLAEARTLAYAIYVLTREGVITTNYILNLRDYLGKSWAKKWESDVTGVYLAAAWSMLKKEDEARRVIRSYRVGQHDARDLCDFYQPLGADAQYIAIVARHFPDLLEQISAQDLRAITGPIGDGEFDTLSAAYAVWALKSYSQHVGQNPPELSIFAIGRDKQERLLPAAGRLVRRVEFPAEATALRFGAKNSPSNFGAFYQVVEAGFDRQLPAHPVARNLEISRELLDAGGSPTQTVKLGEPLTVRLRVRALDRESISNVAIIDLLPGGFEIVEGSLRPGVNQAGCDYVEVREDRVNFFATVGTSVRTISFQIKPCNRGEFVVPPPFAESMYERGVHGCGMAAKITVAETK